MFLNMFIFEKLLLNKHIIKFKKYINNYYYQNI